MHATHFVKRSVFSTGQVGFVIDIAGGPQKPLRASSAVEIGRVSSVEREGLYRWHVRLLQHPSGQKLLEQSGGAGVLHQLYYISDEDAALWYLEQVEQDLPLQQVITM